MEVVSQGPFATGVVSWQPRPGVFLLTVVCKVTAQLTPGKVTVLPVASPVIPFDMHAGNDPRRSLTAASDLVPFKPRAEVLVTGHAHAPATGRGVRQLTARVAVREMDKAVLVSADRYFDLDGELREGAPFTQMPLVWERAAGGPETMNPAGVLTGPDARPDPWGRVILPNLSPPGTTVSSRGDVIAPVGLGPIAATWPSRRSRLLQHAATWDPLRWATYPLPSDFDGSYFQAAPPDQRIEEIAPDERLLLENLIQGSPELVTRLSGTTPRASAHLDSGVTPISLRCDTLVIDTDHATVTTIYRGQLSLGHPRRAGQVVISAETPGHAPRPRRFSKTLPPDQIRSALAAATPFEAKPPAEREQPAESKPQTTLEGTPFRAATGARVGGSALGRSMQLKTSLSEPPSAPPGSGFAAFAQLPSSSVSPSSPSTSGTPFTSPSSPSTSGTPFTSPSSSGAPFTSPGMTGHAEAPASFDEDIPDTVRPEMLEPPRADRLAPPPPDRFSPARADALAPLHADVSPQVIPSRPDVFVPPRSDASAPLAPPPLIGAAPDPADHPEPVEPVTPPRAAPSESEPAKSEPPAPLPQLSDYPPRRCGAIAARLAMRPDDAALLLEAEGLKPEQWEPLHAQQLSLIRDQIARQRQAPLAEYDAAYVAALEAERGAIALVDYAALAEAAERADTEKALADHNLPPTSWPRIQRVWIARFVRDPKLAIEVRRAIDAARDRAFGP